MTPSACSDLMSEVERAVKDGSPERRTRMLQRIADLLVGGAGCLNSSQIAVIDDILLVLIARVDTRTLVQLSKAICQFASPPEKATRRLAGHESAAIAGPILLASSSLREGDLVELASCRGQEHLMAISKRATVSERVTDAILKHAGRECGRTLARNPGARFSETGYATLAAAAEWDETVAESLALRPELPDAIFHRLLCKATETVRARILKAAPPELRQRIQSGVSRITAETAAGTSAKTDHADAMATVEALNRIGKLNDSAVNGFALRHENSKVVAALAVLSGGAFETIETLMKQPGSNGLIVACRASRLNWQTTVAILLHCRRAHPISSKDIELGKALFDSLYVSTAQYTIRFEPPLELTSQLSDDRCLSDARATG